MWRGACRGWNHWRRQRQWRGWMKQPFCSRLKFTDKASCLSDLLGPRKNWGNRSLWAYVFRWGNSIQGDFRCGCRFILEHIKECHQHVCFIRADWSLIILQVSYCSCCSVIEGLFDFTKMEILMGEGGSVSRCCWLHQRRQKWRLCC